MIPIPPEIRGNESFTPAKFKKSVFDVITHKLGEEIACWSFVDLNLGSGQIAIEALSLGFKTVSGCEINNQRIRHLVGHFQSNKYNIHVHKRDMSRASNLLLDLEPVVFFAVPPYSFWENKSCQQLEILLEKLQTKQKKASLQMYGLIQGPANFIPGSSLKKKEKDAALSSDQELPNAVPLNITYRRYANQVLSIVEFFGE